MGADNLDEVVQAEPKSLPEPLVQPGSRAKTNKMTKPGSRIWSAMDTDPVTNPTVVQAMPADSYSTPLEAPPPREMRNVDEQR